MRNVPGGLSAGMAKACGSRKAPGGKNCQVKWSLSQNALRSCTVQGTVNSLRYPKPNSRRPASVPTTSKIGITIAVAIRNIHSGTLRSTVLKDRVDKRGQRTALREPDEHAQDQKERDYRQHPPLFLLPQKLEIVGDDCQPSHRTAPCQASLLLHAAPLVQGEFCAQRIV